MQLEDFNSTSNIAQGTVHVASHQGNFFSNLVANKSQALMAGAALVTTIGAVGLGLGLGLRGGGTPDLSSNSTNNNTSFPSPVVNLPTSNCPLFDAINHTSYSDNLYTLSGRLNQFAFNGTSYFAVMYQNVELIRLVTTRATDNLIRPLANSFISITGIKSNCSLLIADGQGVDATTSATTLMPSTTSTQGAGTVFMKTTSSKSTSSSDSTQSPLATSSTLNTASSTISTLSTSSSILSSTLSNNPFTISVFSSSTTTLKIDSAGSQTTIGPSNTLSAASTPYVTSSNPSVASPSTTLKAGSGSTTIQSKTTVTTPAVVATPTKTTTTSSSAPPTTSTITSNPTYQPRTLAIIFFYFQNDANAPTKVPSDQVNTAFDIYRGMNAVYFNSSYGRVWFSGTNGRANADVYGYVKIPFNNNDNCNYWDWSNSATSLLNIDSSKYDHMMYVGMPASKAICGFSGIANVPGSFTYVLGDYFGIEGTNNHEMGHNIGFYHAGMLDCPDPVNAGQYVPMLDPISGCSTREYGDPYEIMSAKNKDHIFAYHREQVGWLSFPTNVLTVSNKGGNYTIYSLDNLVNSGQPLAVKYRLPTDYTVTRASAYTDYMSYYYFELCIGNPSRTAVTTPTTNGVYIRLGPNPNPSITDPYTYAIYKSLLVVGDSYSDPKQKMKVTLVKIDVNQATLNFVIG